MCNRCRHKLFPDFKVLCDAKTHLFTHCILTIPVTPDISDVVVIADIKRDCWCCWLLYFAGHVLKERKHSQYTMNPHHARVHDPGILVSRVRTIFVIIQKIVIWTFWDSMVTRSPFFTFISIPFCSKSMVPVEGKTLNARLLGVDPYSFSFGHVTQDKLEKNLDTCKPSRFGGFDKAMYFSITV